MSYAERTFPEVQTCAARHYITRCCPYVSVITV